MQHYLKKMVLFFIIPIVLLISLEIVLRLIPNDYKRKREYIHEHGGEIENLILGSSHTYKGIKPDYFLPHSYNLAYSAQSLLFDKMVLEKYLAELPNLKRVVIPISYFSLRKDLGFDEDSPRKYDYFRYHGVASELLSRFDLEYYSVIMNKGFKKSYKVAKDYLVKNKDLITSDSLGWEIVHGKRKKINFADDAQRYITYHNRGVEDFSDNLTVLSDIKASLASQGVSLILITTPVTDEYLDLLDKEALNRIYLAIDEFIQENPSVKYYDFISERTFVHEDFYDSNHLNFTGAIKFSQLLAEVIQAKDSLTKGNVK
ncbi:hypothetical protein JEZ13_11875 [bacterium]|nr:hypothetical protein [bacterium]